MPRPESNLWPLDHESSALTTTPPSHRLQCKHVLWSENVLKFAKRSWSQNFKCSAGTPALVSCDYSHVVCRSVAKPTVRVLTYTTGCLQLLDISLNLYGPPRNFCVKCQWSSTLVSSHKTGYRISFKKLVAFFIFAVAPCCAYHVDWSSSSHAPLNVVALVHCLAGRSNANVSWIFLGIPPRNLLEICWVKFVDTLYKATNYFM